MGGSGSNPNSEGDRPSASQRRSDAESGPLPRILVVEDSIADAFLIRTAIKAAGIEADIHVVKDGEQAVRYFEAADNDNTIPCPSIVLLDINLPKKQGDEVLRDMRGSRRCSHALVMAVSTSDSDRDRENMMRLGANAYFHKPSEYADFMKLGPIVKALLEHPPRQPC